MRILIATSCIPQAGKSEVLLNMFRDFAKEQNVSIPPGILWTHGPGCSNLAMDVIGEDEAAESFANRLTMALMPSKWATTSDALPEVDTVENF